MKSQANKQVNLNKVCIMKMGHSNVIVTLKLGKKRSWTADEDAYLIKLVQKYGAQKWTSIA